MVNVSDRGHRTSAAKARSSRQRHDGDVTAATLTPVRASGNWLDYAVEVGAGASARITGNTISGDTGVATVDGSTSAGIIVSTYYGPRTEATIENNSITGNTEAVAVGYDDTDTSVVTITGNDLAGNSTDAVSSSSPSATVNASGNWWGSANGLTTSANTYAYDGITTGGAAIGNVTVAPWYTSDANTGQTPGWIPAASNTLNIMVPGVALDGVTLADGVTPADGSTASGWTTNTATPTFSGTAEVGADRRDPRRRRGPRPDHGHRRRLVGAHRAYHGLCLECGQQQYCCPRHQRVRRAGIHCHYPGQRNRRHGARLQPPDRLSFHRLRHR